MWDGRLVSRNLISINHKLPCVVQFTNGEQRTLNKYAKIEHAICKCANLNKEEELNVAKWKRCLRLIFNECIFRKRFQWPRGLRCG